MNHDAIIIGGSFAGLSGAMYLSRARRSVVVVDTGSPRNRFARQSHGFFTQDGSDPRAMIAAARAQVMAYPTAAFVEGEAARGVRTADGFAVTLTNGEVLRGARLLLAFGISDELPSIPGLRERWGESVIHCPYCHGFEFSGKRLGVLKVSSRSIHQAMLVAEWGPTTFYLNEGSEPDDASLSELRHRGIAIERTPVRALHGEGLGLSSIELADGRQSGVDALYVTPRTRLRSGIAEDLGCELEDGGSGPIIRTDAEKMTSVPGIWAAGDITRAVHNATWASADGVTAGTAIHRSLVFAPERGSAGIASRDTGNANSGHPDQASLSARSPS